VVDTRIDDLRRRLEREPGSRLFAQLAEELRKAGELGEAIRVSREGLQRHPGYHSARMTLARALFDTGALAQARPEFEMVLGAAPDNILASRLLAETLEGLGDLAGARARFQTTLALAPGDKQVQARLAAVQSKLAAPAPVVAPRAPVAAAPRAGEETPIPLVDAEEGFELESAYEAPATKVGLGEGASGDLGVPGHGALSPELGSDLDQEFVDLEAEARAAPPGRIEIVSRVPLEPEPVPVSGWPPPAAAASPTPELATATLAELYARQGHTARAADTYEQLLEREPANERARARLTELRAAGVTPPAPEGPAGVSRDARRRAIEATISRLEEMLAAVRRR
jgi:tetratricopeptide (TPR) repeat protein